MVARKKAGEDDARHVVHQMCLRSLKRTYGMYLSNYGQRPPPLESGRSHMLHVLFSPAAQRLP